MLSENAEARNRVAGRSGRAVELSTLDVAKLIDDLHALILRDVDCSLSPKQIKSPDVNLCLIRPLVYYIRDNTPMKAAVFAILVNMLSFQKAAEEDLAIQELHKTRANVCEVVAIKLLKHMGMRDLIDALTFDFSTTQGESRRHHTNSLLRALNLVTENQRMNALEVAILARAKDFTASPLVQEVVNQIWRGNIVFFASELDDELLEDDEDEDELPRTTTDHQLYEEERRSLLRNRIFSNPRSAHSRTGRRNSSASGVFKPSSSHRRRRGLSDEELGMHVPKLVNIYNNTTLELGWRDVLRVSRLRVPRYQYITNILIFAVFIAVYTAVVVSRPSSPLSSPPEILLDVLVLAFTLDEIEQLRQSGIQWYLENLWNVFDVIIYMTFVTFIVLRFMALERADNDLSVFALDLLACNAVFLWPRLFAVLDGFQFFGTLLITLKHMLWDMTRFFVLLVVFFVGWMQALYALATTSGGIHYPDGVQGNAMSRLQKALRSRATYMLPGGEDNPGEPNSEGMSYGQIIWVMLKIFFGGQYVGFDVASDFHPIFGPVIMVLYVAISTLVLMTLVIAIMTQSFATIVSNAKTEFLYSFTLKVLEHVKSDQIFPYLPPFNLVRLLIAPVQHVVSRKRYTALLRTGLRICFLPVLVGIFIYEWHWNRRKARFQLEDVALLRSPSIFSPTLNSGSRLGELNFSTSSVMGSRGNVSVADGTMQQEPMTQSNCFPQSPTSAGTDTSQSSKRTGPPLVSSGSPEEAVYGENEEKAGLRTFGSLGSGSDQGRESGGEAGDDTLRKKSNITGRLTPAGTSSGPNRLHSFPKATISESQSELNGLDGNSSRKLDEQPTPTTTRTSDIVSGRQTGVGGTEVARRAGSCSSDLEALTGRRPLIEHEGYGSWPSDLPRCRPPRAGDSVGNVLSFDNVGPGRGTSMETPSATEDDSSHQSEGQPRDAASQKASRRKEGRIDHLVGENKHSQNPRSAVKQVAQAGFDQLETFESVINIPLDDDDLPQRNGVHGDNTDYCDGDSGGRARLNGDGERCQSPLSASISSRSELPGLFDDPDYGTTGRRTFSPVVARPQRQKSLSEPLAVPVAIADAGSTFSTRMSHVPGSSPLVRLFRRESASALFSAASRRQRGLAPYAGDQTRRSDRVYGDTLPEDYSRSSPDNASTNAPVGLPAPWSVTVTEGYSGAAGQDAAMERMQNMVEDVENRVKHVEDLMEEVVILLKSRRLDEESPATQGHSDSPRSAGYLFSRGHDEGPDAGSRAQRPGSETSCYELAGGGGRGGVAARAARQAGILRTSAARQITHYAAHNPQQQHLHQHAHHPILHVPHGRGIVSPSGRASNAALLQRNRQPLHLRKVSSGLAYRTKRRKVRLGSAGTAREGGAARGGSGGEGSISALFAGRYGADGSPDGRDDECRRAGSSISQY